MRPSLLILAAGMGSRYGGLKQLDTFGPNNETIIDYSIFDAINAGFQKIVFVIRRDFEKDFKDKIESKWSDKAELCYAFQELDSLPAPYTCPADRKKPWGTGHAIWVAKNIVNEPFGVINADDFYGREAMQDLYKFLNTKADYAVISYLLSDTLSEHGTVNRGVCSVSYDGYLEKIVECKNIHKNVDVYFELNGIKTILDPNTPVSMNMWAMGLDYFDYAESYFIDFLNQFKDQPSSEFYIPDLIQFLIDQKIKKIQVISTRSKWFGVTYKEDKSVVEKAIREMIVEGKYPDIL